MRSHKSVFRIPSSSRIPLHNFGKILTLLTLLVATAAASAAPVLSRISCTSNVFSAAGTDACSVYLTTNTTGRFPVTLVSNNPAVSVPSAVTLRPKATNTGFNATVTAVTTTQVATITAKAGGVSTTYNITISPAAGAARLSLNATSIGFGSVAENTPETQALTLSSTGTAPVTVNSTTVSGTGFSVSGGTLPARLNPGQSLTLEVQFDPATAGSFSGQLTINSSASAATVGLSGVGQSHQVDLSWSSPAGSSDPIAGYNIYRAPSGTTSYQRANATVETQTAYADTAVQGAASYSYYVTSVDAEGRESGPSNTTTVTVP